jgi:hypothetical protein
LASDLQDRCSIRVVEFLTGDETLSYVRGNLFGSDAKCLLACSHLVERNAIEQSFDQRQQHSDLFNYRNWRKFRLLETGANTLAVSDDLARAFIETRAESGESFKLLKLRIS